MPHFPAIGHLALASNGVKICVLLISASIACTPQPVANGGLSGGASGGQKSGKYAAAVGCVPTASVSTATATDVNPPTWAWLPCATTPRAYLISLDGGPQARVTSKTYTPEAEIAVGAHVLTVIEVDASDVKTAPASFKLNVTPRALLGTAAAEPGAVDLNSTATPVNAIYRYPVDTQNQTIAANRLELAGSGGFVPDDILQGEISDCYFMATLMAVANANPALLSATVVQATDADGEPMIDRQGYALYMTNFYVPGENGAGTIWRYMTDARLPYDSSTGANLTANLAVDNNGNYKIGIPIIEKAFARLNQDTGFLKKLDPADTYYTSGQGYANIMGGYTYDALRLFATAQNVLSDAASTASLATNQPGNGQALTLSLDYRKTAGAQLPSGATTVLSTDTLTYTSADGRTVIKLPTSHDYTFLKSQNGVATVRNPWGSTPQNDSAYEYGKGAFTIPVQDIAAIFTVTAANTSNLLKAAPSGGSGT